MPSLKSQAFALCVVLPLVLGLSRPPPAQAETLLGFSESASTAQRAMEAQLDAGIDAAEMEAWLKQLSKYPHHAGSPASKPNAEFIAAQFRSWGYDVEIEEYEVLMPTPKERELELVAPTSFKAGLTEETLAEDPSSARRETLLPPYNAFSVDGDVEAELVFVNYGSPADYEVLERYGIDVKGKIVIAKYGQTWRGIKPKLAGEKGAIGTIIYSDPADDGYGAGDVYPAGPFKNDSGVQRGSVVDMPTYPGDVLTPGVGATSKARRLKQSDVEVITKVPVMPISYRDALPLLSALRGAVVPAEWRGSLPITYHFGPGPAKVRMKVSSNWDMTTIYNVIARLPGSQFPDEWVIRGNHHDGWNHGAADPVSGLVAMMAEAKSIGALAKAGQRPLRTLVYAAWDAEEPGLIGSTEWAEQHAKELQQKAVAYINTDNSSRGFAYVGGSHTLERFFNQVMEDVQDPVLGGSVKDRRRAYQRIYSPTEQLKSEAKDRADLRLDPLGSGSDFTPFLQHLGIPTAHLGFFGEGEDGSYHTLYDTHEHFLRFVDPGMTYGAVLAQFAGRASLRLANAQRLPFEFTGFADNIKLYLGELEELADAQRKATETNRELVEAGAYRLALDPHKTQAAPAVHEPVPHFNFAPLQNALGRLEKAAQAYDAIANDAATAAGFNALLSSSERLLTREEGLPGRTWFKHFIYAPGYYTGYGVKTIPGVREAIEERHYDKVDAEIVIAAEVLDAMSARIEQLVAMSGGD
jgi:N-acetylated-alpha-linked acidic dipeptidase